MTIEDLKGKNLIGRDFVGRPGFFRVKDAYETKTGLHAEIEGYVFLLFEEEGIKRIWHISAHATPDMQGVFRLVGWDVKLDFSWNFDRLEKELGEKAEMEMKKYFT